ncbi:hypothetical protein BVY04_00100 [bacterium M21]|nr:hypothetical protein BVY04_00100 [bacterium M21]
MANELNIPLDPVRDAGLSVTAKVRQAGGTQVGSTVTMSEVGSGYYTGDFTLAAIADGVYSVEFLNATSGRLIGKGELAVRSHAESTLPLVEQKSEADTRQTALIAEHDATQAAIAGQNDFDPAVDVVANVTLVDTTTANTDMRGTDGANTIAPDNAGIAANGVAIGNLNDFDPTTQEVTTDIASREASKADVSAIETKAQADTRQTALIAEHDATQGNIAGLNDFDPAALSALETKAQADARQALLIGEHNETQAVLQETHGAVLGNSTYNTGTKVLAIHKSDAPAELLAEFDIAQDSSMTTVSKTRR